VGTGHKKFVTLGLFFPKGAICNIRHPTSKKQELATKKNQHPNPLIY
jgi:hypothetical protein